MVDPILIAMGSFIGILVGLTGVWMASWLCNHLPGRPLWVGIAAMLAISSMHLF